LLFDLLADMPHYGRWLPDSDAFGGTRDVFPYPVQQGTRYIDYGPAGERHGVVTQFDPPTRLVFHQTWRCAKACWRTAASWRSLNVMRNRAPGK
jgi:uncharacterized protein YndB with AHSA1/START domain